MRDPGRTFSRIVAMAVLMVGALSFLGADGSGCNSPSSNKGNGGPDVVGGGSGDGSDGYREGSTSGSTDASPSEGGSGSVATAIVAGSNHTCALVKGGVQCWGHNVSGQLGNNTRIDSSVPVAVIGLGTASGVMAIAAGLAHTCALVSGGVQCWGDNTEGQLGSNLLKSDVPVQVAGLGPASGVTAIAAGGGHSCALVGGGVQCWGDNTWGELGNGSTVNSKVPVQVAGLDPTSNAMTIAAGADQTCAIANGGLQCWGWNQFGDLGNDSFSQSSFPVAVVGLDQTSGVSGVAGGGGFTCARVRGGVQCWGGEGGYGNLGNSSAGDSPLPVWVSNLGPTSTVTAIGLGAQHACAVEQGGLQCWGDNGTGQLGNNSTTISSVPVAVVGLGPQSGVTAVAAGFHHTCAVVSRGVRCWGYNDHGQLGNGTTDPNYVPVAVSAWAP
jgi:alpha-tubulin suppressor-like RCC1 family protein